MPLLLIQKANQISAPTSCSYFSKNLLTVADESIFILN